MVSQIASEDNLADPFTKGLDQKIFDQHIEGMGVRCIDVGVCWVCRLQAMLFSYAWLSQLS